MSLKEDNLPPFRYYETDEGDGVWREIRIEKGCDDSGVRAMGVANLRAWKLHDRGLKDPDRPHEHRPWTLCETVYLPNSASWADAERRLLHRMKIRTT